MTVRFADTFYFLALLNEVDAAHQSALEYAGRQASMLVTTDWVIVEVADALAAPAQRPAFLALWEEIRHAPRSRSSRPTAHFSTVALTSTPAASTRNGHSPTASLSS